MVPEAEATLYSVIPLILVQDPLPCATYAHFTLAEIYTNIEEDGDLERFEFMEEHDDEICNQLSYFFSRVISPNSAPFTLNFMTEADDPSIIAAHKIMSRWESAKDSAVPGDADLHVQWTISLVRMGNA